MTGGLKFLRPTIVTLLMSLLAIGCSGDSHPPTSDVFGMAPWTGDETAMYDVKTDRGEMLGREELRIDVDGERTTLTQLFVATGRRDESKVVVESRTLKPISSIRTIVTSDEDEAIEVTYTDAGALIKQGDKQSGLSVPEHSYDNDSSLFLWRTLPFAEGYEAAYNTIITNFRSRQVVTLKVARRETVRVPAGEFMAWRLEIKTSNANQVAWYADTPAHPLVKYDNDRGVIFELTRLP
jgi:hypothetical protein